MKLIQNLYEYTRGKALCPLFLFLFFTFSEFYANAVEDPMTIEGRYEALIDSAEIHASKHQWEEAENATISALRLIPANKANWLLWSNLAEIRIKRNNPDGALEAYDIGLSIQPDSQSMLEGRAGIYLSENRDSEALEDLSTLLKINPMLEWPLLMRGYLLLKKGFMDKAEADFKNLIEAYPENSFGYSGLAAIRSKNGDVKEGERFYRKSLEINPDENVYYQLTVLLLDSDRLQDATETVREGIKKFPRCGNLYLLRAYIHKKSFQNQEAEAALKLAREFGADDELLKMLN